MSSRLNFMRKVRAFEERCIEHAAEIRCAVHPCIGQEAVPAALAELLRPDDWLFSHHRSHGHYFAKGGSEDALWDEITGKPTGVNGGWCGSQLLAVPALNFHAGAIVGGILGAAAGCALRLKRQGSDAIAVVCVGDAAAETGVFWETVNFAGIEHLPLVIVVENNGYSTHAPLVERQATSITHRVKAFGVHAVGTSGADVDKVAQELARLVEVARFAKPGVLEVTVERMCPHIIGHPDFRTRMHTRLDPLLEAA